ncbi:MAG: cytochrome c biogenesis protein CcsA [Syntrophomonadaceae bacterium]|jgi:ABC-type transport system involved in cytochrome c biogenesis permease subunit|nr:cytochrome c biogenesis protein CcsA [Syntrophomonadaceae bacterium]
MAVIIKTSLIVALILYFLSGTAYLLGIKGRQDKLLRAANITAIIGALSNITALAARTIMTGRLPLTDGYEFLLLFTLVSVLLYLLYEKLSKNQQGGSVLMIMAALLLATVFIFMPQQHGNYSPLMPALKSPWLTSHVLSAVVAYSAFTLGAALAFMQLIKKNSSEDINVYRAVGGGFVMLSISIVLGGVWAEQAWGTYWSWDPKETWALITWIIYAIYLHVYRSKGWRGNNANIMVLGGFILVLFTFFGVNYLLSGLHSYG